MSILSLIPALTTALFLLAGSTAAVVPPPPSVVLLTLDTTRADHLGCYGSQAARTPVLDALAARGTRYATALTASPLTLPAHTSLMTGLLPIEHGVRENGTAALDPAVPTLAGRLSARGYATGAFVASRVLDRRFGLDAGFDHYDDSMVAEQTGEYGYPERDAAAVTSAALQWLAGLDPSRPYFLWVHYYDPHSPYRPPVGWRGGSDEASYAGEIAYVDAQIGRLLAALPSRSGAASGSAATTDGGSPVDSGPLIAVVGDHGEALGEHGERSHGIFLYRAGLEVPLLLAGPGVPAGQVVDEVVASRRLAASVLGLVGADDLGADDRSGPSAPSGDSSTAATIAPRLPGLPSLGDDPPAAPVYSESRMPASAYGWSPLEALSDQRWRLIVAPRPELYDWRVDPAETRNLIEVERRQAGRLKSALEAIERSADARLAGAAPIDSQLAADLRALGYLSGSGGKPGTIDPKDGIVLLEQLRVAKERMRAGDLEQATAMMRDLHRRNPANIPFLTHLGQVELAGGNADGALAAYRQAVSLNPGLDFLHLNLADAYLQLGRTPEARAELERAVELNPRSARAWLGLGQLTHAAGSDAEERRLLREAVAAGTGSSAIHARLGQLEAQLGDLEAADENYRRATELAPGWALGWLLWGQNAEARGLRSEALERYRRAATIDPRSPAIRSRLERAEREMEER